MFTKKNWDKKQNFFQTHALYVKIKTKQTCIKQLRPTYPFFKIPNYEASSTQKNEQNAFLILGTQQIHTRIPKILKHASNNERPTQII